MKYIAHRGLTNGPDKELENRPDQIELSLSRGYDCEVDLWIVHSELWLGHDEPQYIIDEDFVNKMGLWIHAKNLSALRWLRNTSLNYFWHENDHYTLTSHNWIWTNPGNALTTASVMVMPEAVDAELTTCKNAKCYAICSDYIEKIIDLRK
jgi:hypothetical protein